MPLFKQVQQRLGKLNTVLQENLAGVRVVKAFVREDYETKRYIGFGGYLVLNFDPPLVSIGIIVAFLNYVRRFYQPIRELALSFGRRCRPPWPARSASLISWIPRRTWLMRQGL